MKNPGKILFLITIMLFGFGCASHKIDIQQGNVITQELVDSLKLGMEKKQIQRLLGSPMIEDPFHRDRWDYLYRFVTGDTGEIQSGYVVLFFKDDLLTAIDVRSNPPKESEIKTPALTR